MGITPLWEAEPLWEPPAPTLDTGQQCLKAIGAKCGVLSQVPSRISGSNTCAKFSPAALN